MMPSNVSAIEFKPIIELYDSIALQLFGDGIKQKLKLMDLLYSVFNKLEIILVYPEPNPPLIEWVYKNPENLSQISIYFLISSYIFGIKSFATQ